MLFAWQLVDCLVCFAWSFTVTGLILLALNKIPGLALTIDDDDEINGIDAVEMGESTFDYLKLINMPKPRMKEIGTSPASQPSWGLKAVESSIKNSRKASKEGSEEDL
eukprot:NODE_200_length_15202_cov_0.356618.p12 type:complete len:108 gc:universal NODE_200_length_15202_cov_0.356618:8675-8352(-)